MYDRLKYEDDLDTSIVQVPLEYVIYLETEVEVYTENEFWLPVPRIICTTSISLYASIMNPFVIIMKLIRFDTVLTELPIVKNNTSLGD